METKKTVHITEDIHERLALRKIKNKSTIQKEVHNILHQSLIEEK